MPAERVTRSIIPRTQWSLLNFCDNYDPNHFTDMHKSRILAHGADEMGYLAGGTEIQIPCETSTSHCMIIQEMQLAQATHPCEAHFTLLNNDCAS